MLRPIETELRWRTLIMLATRDSPASEDLVLAFGPFRLVMSQRRLLRAGQPVRLGSRALEILLALIERAGQTVRKSELHARVWPSIVVEEGTLRVHIAALRKALGEHNSNVRYIENVTGQGYRFIAKLDRLDNASVSAMSGATSILTAASVAAAAVEPAASAGGQAAYLPGLGRDGDMQYVLDMLSDRHLVTITGAGGIGKTRLAMAVVANVGATQAGEVRFAELASICDATELSRAVAASVGVPPASEDVALDFASLKNRRMLLVLDNCEQVIDEVARIVETIRSQAPDVRILATSREPLRAVGESVLRLRPLRMPRIAVGLSLAEALQFPAIELFIERARQSCCRFRATDTDVPAIAQICQRLEGVPLWIELAAARVGLIGVHGVVAQLDNLLTFLTEGRRTAPRRQQTLRATLDWSFDLLSTAEKRMLSELAAFDGCLDLFSVEKAISEETVAAGAVVDVVMGLASKSLIFSTAHSNGVQLRVPDIVRQYVLQKDTVTNQPAFPRSAGFRRIPQLLVAHR